MRQAKLTYPGDGYGPPVLTVHAISQGIKWGQFSLPIVNMAPGLILIKGRWWLVDGIGLEQRPTPTPAPETIRAFFIRETAYWSSS